MRATQAIENDGLESRKQRWRDFLKPDAKPGFMFRISFNDPTEPALTRPPLWPSQKQERIDWSSQAYERMMKDMSWLHDDQVPYVSAGTGTEVFAEAFGCPVERPSDTMPFARPCVFTAAEADAIRVPEVSGSSMAYLFEIADALRARFGADVPLQIIDVQSPMDIAALIWDKEKLFAAMIDEPEAVHALAAKVRQFMTAFFDEWFRRYGTEYIAHCPDYFIAGGLTLSEDEIGVVSAAMFREFFRDELVVLSKRYGGLGMHCCADSRHQWENLRDLPGLKALNLCCPPSRDGKEFIGDAYRFFDGRLMQVHGGGGWCLTGPVKTWPRQFPKGRKVMFYVPAANRDEAIRHCAALHAVRRGKTATSN